MRLSEQKCLIIAHVIPSIASSIFFRKCLWIRGTSRNVGKRTSADWAKYSVSPFEKLIRSHARPLTVTRWISLRWLASGRGIMVSAIRCAANRYIRNVGTSRLEDRSEIVRRMDGRQERAVHSNQAIGN